MNIFLGFSFLSKHGLSRKDCEDSINSVLHLSASRYYTDNIMQALVLMEQSPMYGITFFQITNKKRTNLLLGVDCYGMCIYLPKNRKNPETTLSWSEIHSISYTNSEFAITPRNKTDPKATFYGFSLAQCRKMFDTVVKNHKLFLQRRRCDSQLKAEIDAATAAQEKFAAYKKQYDQEQHSFIMSNEIKEKLGKR
ncbi:hypothetical protein HZS_6391 [Henneguya salminicola]|nr:hypothetical protein HZS_6391 [Henneguya salminicola]